MKKAISLLLSAFLLMFILSACGQSQENVTGKLKKKLDHLEGYKAEATMTLYAGDKPSTYDMEIWHKNPNFYRIHLKNQKQQLSQMILKNEEGVFVLTPQLNKSYRFQSDWPKNGSQWYLYESLLTDILNDSDPAFTRNGDTYTFRTKTNYKHSDLQTQVITLTKRGLKPVSVKIKNGDDKTIVDMKFKSMVFDANFDGNAFDLRKNMESASMEEVPTMGQKSGKSSSFHVLYPTALQDESKLSVKKVTDDNGKKYVFQYDGDKPFTLIEQKSKVSADVEPASVPGEPVNLGFAIGHMTKDSISWTYAGTDFFLASKNLSEGQMVDLARSVLGKQKK